MKKLILFAILLLSFFLCSYSFQQINTLDPQLKFSPDEELLYFPSGKNLHLVSLGFSNALADYLWFQTVNYFGKHYRGDKSYYWLSHMCDVITDLDPYHKQIYEFCALLIAWEAEKPEAAQRILTKGIKATNYWRFYYLRGMNSVIFEKDQNAARNDFITGADLADTPKMKAFISRLAAKQISEVESPLTAINFLHDMIERSEDPNQKQALVKHYKRAIGEYRVSELKKYLALFKGKFNLLPDKLEKLQEVGAKPELFKDAFEKKYYLTTDGKIETK